MLEQIVKDLVVQYNNKVLDLVVLKAWTRIDQDLLVIIIFRVKKKDIPLYKNNL